MLMFYENVRLALTSIRANKMRSLLTMLGIIIGIASVIAIMTVGNSLTISVNDTMSSFGANDITVSLTMKQDEESTEEGFVFSGFYRYASPEPEDYLTKEMIEDYVNVYQDSIDSISVSESVQSGQMVEGKLYANVNVVGVNSGFLKGQDLDILGGREFNASELLDARRVCMISDYAVNNLFDGDVEKALGQDMQVNLGDKFYNFTIIGVYKYEQSAYSISFTSERETTTYLFIPVRTAKNMTHTEGYSSMTVKAASGVDADKFAKTTQHFFNKFYYKDNRTFAVQAYTLTSVMDTLNSMMGKITTAISIIAGIALLVGGIGVMNIMLVSITERTREIGTRKALGAPNSSIRMQFIVEAMVLCIIGGIIGVILGVSLGSLAANLLKTPANPSISSILIALLFSMGIGIFFGYYPANKAAKMDPIEALRYE